MNKTRTRRLATFTMFVLTNIAYPQQAHIAQPNLSNPSLALEPPPILESLTNSLIEVDIKNIELGDEVRNLESFLSKGNEGAKIQLLEISSEIPYWLDENSATGRRSKEMLLSWAQKTLLEEYLRLDPTATWVTEDSLIKSMLSGATKESLLEGSKTIADLIGRLLMPFENLTSIDRSISHISFKTSPFSHILVSLVIVDPFPMSAPDKKTFLVIIERTYEE